MRAVGSRIQYLDGLRGLAIISVVIWHFYGPTYERWLPFGLSYSKWPLASYGWTGVELFFLISGFVIFMTVESCASFREFLIRRWLRLFPAMLIATIIIFGGDRLLSWQAPYANARLVDIVPGLTFISPAILHVMLRVDIDSLDGVFWTLYTEVAFYFVFGALYFTLGWKRAIAGLGALAVGVIGAGLLISKLHAPHLVVRAVEPLRWMGFGLFGWFAAGALFYKSYQLRSGALLAAAIGVGSLSAMFHPSSHAGLVERAIMFGIVLLFAAVQTSPILQRAFSLRPIQFIGRVSYPLYLIHNEIGIGVMNGISAATGQPLLASCLALAGIVFGAWAIERFAEPGVRNLVKPLGRLAMGGSTGAHRYATSPST